MIALKKLMVVIDPEQDAQLALEKALKLARISGAALELVICDHNTYLEDGYYFDPPEAFRLRQEHIARHRQLLEEMADVIRAQGFSAEVDALWGRPVHEKLIEKAVSSGADLLIQGTRHHEKISRLLLSHQDWELIRYCPCPVLLVKDEAWHQDPVVIVAIDPTHANDKPAELDRRLVQAGKLLTGPATSNLHLYHSAFQPPVAGLYPITANVEVTREAAAGLMEEFGVPQENLHIESGEIHNSLPRLTRSLGGDIVVMGAISRSRIDRFLIGNTAEKLLDRLAQDVLVIKPAGFRGRGEAV
jgi:universal stress protein E